MTLRSPGADLRDATLDMFEDYRPDFLAQARAIAKDICKERGTCTVDEVRKVCPPPKSVDPRVMGAIFRSTEFEKVSYENSGRRDCHARPIARFKLRSDA